MRTFVAYAIVATIYAWFSPTPASADVLRSRWVLVKDDDPMAKQAEEVAFAPFDLPDGSSFEAKVSCKREGIPGAVMIELSVHDARYAIRRERQGNYIPFRLKFDDLDAVQTISLVDQYSNVARISFLPRTELGKIGLSMARSIGASTYPIEMLQNHKRLLFEAQLQSGRPVLEIDLAAQAIVSIVGNCKS